MKLEKTVEDIKSLQPEIEKLKALKFDEPTFIGQPKESKTNWHFRVSIAKSFLRVLAGVTLIQSHVITAGILLILAEILGIIEEL